MNRAAHHYTETDSPLGTILLCATARGLTGLYMENHRGGPDHAERAGWTRDDAPFAVVFRDAQPECDAQGFASGENRGARITLLLGDVPKRLVVREQQRLEHVRRAARFLEAEHVRLFLGDEGEEIFAQHGAQAVDVPGDQLQAATLYR